MKSLPLALLLSFSLACANKPAADASSQTQAAATSSGVKAIGEAKIGDKSNCPVSKEEFTVTAESPKVEHGGKTYYFCCSGCAEKFKASPEKFLEQKT